MDRRKFVISSSAGILGSALGRTLKAAGQAEGSNPATEESGEFFPAQSLPERAWSQFTAAGFTEPVCGLIYRGTNPAECGLPLGAVATGGVDLDTDGTLGYCSMFGSFVPPRGPLRQPFLGLRVGKQSWVLATRNTEEIEQVEKAREIHYWGHYPVADLEYVTSAPVSVGLRAWTPFIPGDVALSNTPGAVFEVRVRNQSAESQSGSVIFNFPGPTQGEVQVSPTSPRRRVHYNWFWAMEPVAAVVATARRVELEGELNGISVSSEAGVGYTLAVLDGEKALAGGQRGVVGSTWGHRGPAAQDDEFGASLTVDFELEPRQAKTIRFVLAWYAPLWKGEGSHSFTQMYATRYADSVAVARRLAREHGAILQRILNWQQAIYTYPSLPVWLREALVNNLYLITEVGMWAAAKPPIGDWCRQQDGLFGMNESPRECPQIECIPCSFYGNVPLVYFFPELALSTLRGYNAYQYPDGAAPWIFGGCTGHPKTEGTEMATPNRGYQTTTNGISYADMVDRYLLRAGGDKILAEFYPSVKRNMIYTMNLNPGPDGAISMPKDNIDPATGAHATEWVEGERWFGMTSHVGGLHLAQLRIVERMAEKAGDRDFARQCRNWFQQGSDSMENKLWAGEYYLAYYEPESGKRSDHIFSCQLDGDWISRFHGLPPVFRPERARAALRSIQEKNSRLSPYGTVFFANPDGTPWEQAGYGPYTYFVSEQLMLAMTCIYAGEVDFGLEQARRCLYNLVQKGYLWNQPCIVQAATGERISGYDYYQNMMLWALPAAIEHADLSAACSAGGLVDRIIKAGSRA